MSDAAPFDCSACGRTIGRSDKHHLFRGEKTCAFCGACAASRDSRGLHRIVHPSCDVPWHDVWDHTDSAFGKNRFEARILVKAWSDEDRREQYGPETAGDLIILGLCSGACLVADEASAKACDCRCGGQWHGALMDAQIDRHHDDDDEGDDAVPRMVVNDGVPLVGQFFHTFTTHPDGCRLVSNQGKVIGRVSQDLYLVQLYEWLTGSPGARELRKTDDMLGWQFYPDGEALQFEYEHRGWSMWAEQHVQHEKEERKAS